MEVLYRCHRGDVDVVEGGDPAEREEDLLSSAEAGRDVEVVEVVDEGVPAEVPVPHTQAVSRSVTVPARPRDATHLCRGGVLGVRAGRTVPHPHEPVDVPRHPLPRPQSVAEGQRPLLVGLRRPRAEVQVVLRVEQVSDPELDVPVHVRRAGGDYRDPFTHDLRLPDRLG